MLVCKLDQYTEGKERWIKKRQATRVWEVAGVLSKGTFQACLVSCKGSRSPHPPTVPAVRHPPEGCSSAEVAGAPARAKRSSAAAHPGPAAPAASAQ